MKISIYTLSCPFDGTPKYIGLSSRPQTRLRSHITASKDSGLKNEWIRSLLRKKKKPKLEIIETVEKDDASSSEKFFIEYFKFLGFRLFNQTKGGEGLGCYLTEDQKKEKIILQEISRLERYYPKNMQSFEPLADPFREAISLAIRLGGRDCRHGFSVLDVKKVFSWQSRRRFYFKNKQELSTESVKHLRVDVWYPEI
jgi:predicted GIY-YIG superfamily endonuclease